MAIQARNVAGMEAEDGFSRRERDRLNAAQSHAGVLEAAAFRPFQPFFSDTGVCLSRGRGGAVHVVSR